MNKLKKIFNRERQLALLSLIATPFIIFAVTSVDIYLKNKNDLDNRVVVLFPFLFLFFVAIASGFFFYCYSGKNKLLKLLLLAYYLTGPAFLIFSAVRKTKFNILAFMVLAVIFILTLLYLRDRKKVAKVSKIFIWFSAIMLVSEVLTISNSVRNNKSESRKEEEKTSVKIEASVQGKYPNVYHIIFDEYQTDMFDLTLNQKAKDQLDGFVYYPKNTTLYGRTGMSLPSIFTGLSYDYEMPQLEYQKQAFNSDKSILFWLKKSGYETNAFVHKVYSFNLDLFDSVIENNKNASSDLENFVYVKLFFNLWIYANTPEIVSEKIMQPEFLEQIKNQNILSNSAPVVSKESFYSILKDEQLLGSSNKYLFVHLILPHFPYVLKSDCSYDGKETSPIEQSECATKMITDLINTLKMLGKFDDSLIIIQGDHGSRFKVKNDELMNIDNGFYSKEWSFARSRAMLLIKTPGRKSTEPLILSDAETSLLDIAPTIADATGIETNFSPEGISLTNPEIIISARSRYYHFFEKKGKNESTDELSRFIIKGDDIEFEKNISLKK